MFTNPTAPNIADFNTFVIGQGVPAADLPSGALTTIAIDTSGNLTAASATGTIATGMALVGTNIPENTYIATWSGTTGTVTPVPVAAVSTASAQAYSPWLQWAFIGAMAVTLIPPPCMPAILYVMAVYNYGMHKLLKIGQDLSGQTFFTIQRQNFNLLSFKAGPVASSADQATSSTLVTPDFLKGLTMGDLDLLLTPWGREYLDYSQQYGPSIVGVS
ncbi:hypothetical protein [Burkholderia lata]|uniref:Uncharacterized protein n=1 Tax=Burkholderia lata (strain ATCC 17760 / DSM 23089 / LMG 22485 / NCIMB 9086 / R18194 / 383) TaxID=482957 RepID=A0A6P2GTX5_BURL3|nr:hypothetical protein [Burkholderia lata]VWB07228.1 hypothetical protein BLA6863_00156 [Burkholderia lata]